MELNEAKQILNINGYLVETTDTIVGNVSEDKCEDIYHYLKKYNQDIVFSASIVTFKTKIKLKSIKLAKTKDDDYDFSTIRSKTTKYKIIEYLQPNKKYLMVSCKGPVWLILLNHQGFKYDWLYLDVDTLFNNDIDYTEFSDYVHTWSDLDYIDF